MAITTLDGLRNGFKAQRLQLINKASLGTQVVGGYTALWRATGLPQQGAIPAAAAVCDDTLLGALPLPSKIGGEDRVLSFCSLQYGTASQSLIIEDRLAHMGGLNGTLLTSQTVGVDVSVATSNMAERRGAATYENVEWWLEWYTTTGATGVNATLAVTYDDNSTTNIVIALAASMAASRRLPILPTTAGRWIKSIQSCILSASTGTAGSFGVTATRTHTITTAADAINKRIRDGWAELGSPEIPNSSCISFSVLSASTTIGTVVGNMKYSVL